MRKEIDKIIYGILSAAVGSKIDVAPLYGNTDNKPPLMLYSAESFEPERTKTGVVGYQTIYSVDIYTKMYEDGYTIADDVVKALDGYRDRLIKQCRLESGSFDYTDNGHALRSLKFKVYHA